MKCWLLALLFVCVSFHPIAAKGISAYSADQLMARVAKSDTTYIINFWASWCGPCVKELPQFDELVYRFSGKPVKVLLVSMDFEEDYPEKLEKYVSRKKLLPEVIWFSDTKPDEFIPKIEPSWSGAIPVTLIIAGSKGKRLFLAHPVTVDEVASLIEK
ncbi:MAG: TlpA family protein disulfide reductase [Bacteroidetes bacterium]|nr:TlpA family protein disulfide reductase [Bacteroidota bacterium]